MRIGTSSINYMLRVRGISQRMQGITIERIIPIFAIASFDHDCYPGGKSCYLTGDAALVNCDLYNSVVSCPAKRQENAPWGFQTIPHPTLYPIVCQTYQLTLPWMDAPPRNLLNPQHNHQPLHIQPQGGYLGSASSQWCRKKNHFRGDISTTLKNPHNSNSTKRWNARH